MRKFALVVAIASTAIASPAFARDGSAYIGVDIGAMKASSQDFDFASPNHTVPTGLNFKYNTGWDADVLGGYDLGMFRVEVEAGYKRASVDRVLVNQEPAALFGVPFGGLDSDGSVKVGSGMLNALFDFGGNDDWGGSVGGGIGIASVKERAGLAGGALNFRDQDRALAFQGLAEVRAALSPNFDVGLKYRYFQTAKLDFGPFCVTTCTPTYSLKSKFKSNSLLLSLVYNFVAAAPPPPPPAPPPPPPPPPPATQTCPDGSVILATSTCPVPPPPPPPPPAERGERGE